MPYPGITCSLHNIEQYDLANGRHLVKISLYLSVVVIASIISFSAFASEKVDQDDNQLLLASCQSLATTPEQVKAKPCVYYIPGIIAAAQAIDPPVINQETKKKRKPLGIMSGPYYHGEKIPLARFFLFAYLKMNRKLVL